MIQSKTSGPKWRTCAYLEATSEWRLCKDVFSPSVVTAGSRRSSTSSVTTPWLTSGPIWAAWTSPGWITQWLPLAIASTSSEAVTVLVFWTPLRSTILIWIFGWSSATRWILAVEQQRPWFWVGLMEGRSCLSLVAMTITAEIQTPLKNLIWSLLITRQQQHRVWIILECTLQLRVLRLLQP